MSATNLLGSFASPSNTSISFRNVLINGNFDFWQRGTFVSLSYDTGGGTYLADRWLALIDDQTGNAVPFYEQRSTITPNFNSLYCARLFEASGLDNTALNTYTLGQNIEMRYALPLVGRRVAVSFWYRSDLTGQHAVAFTSANMTGGSGSVTPFIVNAANTWQYVTLNFSSMQAVTAITGGLETLGAILKIGFYDSGIGQSVIPGGSYFEISQVQVEAGVATPFEQRSPGLELALCQRYYYRQGGSNYSSFGIATIRAGDLTKAYMRVQFPVTMRDKPNLSFGGAIGTVNSNRVVSNFGSLDAQQTTTHAAMHEITLTAAGTEGLSFAVGALNDVNAYVAYSAEL